MKSLADTPAISRLYEFTAKTPPKAKKRVKVYSSSGGMHGVNPSQKDEKILKKALLPASDISEEPLNGAIFLGIKFFISPAKSTTKKRFYSLKPIYIHESISASNTTPTLLSFS